MNTVTEGFYKPLSTGDVSLAREQTSAGLYVTAPRARQGIFLTVEDF